MQMNLRIKAALAGMFVSLAALGSSAAPPQNSPKVAEGARLFALNCAHCHGADATGDEGPDLHGVRKSDAKITSYIKNGIKGEMPKFGQKLSDADVQALIAYIRSLKE
jgi:cytochrome c oxidase cbb3-type subunit 3